MPHWNREKFDFNRERHRIHPDENLSWREVVEHSRERGGSTFKKYRVKEYNYEHHGSIYSGPVNFFFCFSMNKKVTSIDDDIRRYHVVCMTPWGNILHAHDKDIPYEGTSIRLVFEDDKERGVKTAKGLASRKIDPKQWKWY